MTVLIMLTTLAMLASLYLVLVWVPTEKTMGVIQRVFYFHVPSAWVAFLAFAVAAVAALLFLARRQEHWDRVEVASLELGIVFSTVALITGSIWARPIWNTWWTWDPRLTTTLVMWIYYVASLLLRQMVDSPERSARFGAVLAIVGFVNVPLVFLTIRLWRTIHPVLFTTEGFGLAPEMLLTLLISLGTFTLLYFCLLTARVRLESLQARLAQLRDQYLSE
ncbi:MAG TPA: cytochrome c biogenesis protein CcsA [Anaerolineae bacterium]|nr:cytochrome c biogenesis protein CcsA [Anaerolineae bacterium]HQJ50193.1 cytochrome c biogenesis protein CcsA [Anaerolineae bacterium]